MNRGFSKKLKPVREYIKDRWKFESDIIMASNFETVSSLTIRRLRYGMGLRRSKKNSEHLKNETLLRRKNQFI